MVDPDDPLLFRELQVRRLCRDDADAAAIWEDYREVLAQLRRLRRQADPPPSALADYVRLRAELCEELTRLLDARFPPRDAGS